MRASNNQVEELDLIDVSLKTVNVLGLMVERGLLLPEWIDFSLQDLGTYLRNLAEVRG